MTHPYPGASGLAGRRFLRAAALFIAVAMPGSVASAQTLRVIEPAYPSPVWEHLVPERQIEIVDLPVGYTVHARLVLGDEVLISSSSSDQVRDTANVHVTAALIQVWPCPVGSKLFLSIRAWTESGARFGHDSTNCVPEGVETTFLLPFQLATYDGAELITGEWMPYFAYGTGASVRDNDGDAGSNWLVAYVLVSDGGEIPDTPVLEDTSQLRELLQRATGVELGAP